MMALSFFKILRPIIECRYLSTLNRNTQPIVSSEYVLSLLEDSKTNKNRPVILDVSKGSDIDYAARFLDRHLPSAFLFDFTHRVRPTKTFPCGIPEKPEIFEQYIQSFGINGDTKVIIYETVPASKAFIAAGRAWWLFRYFGHENVCVLDGGIARWEELGSPIETGSVSKPEIPGNFQAKINSNLLIEFEEISKNLENFKIVDSRTRETFMKGFIPGSVNIPWNDLFNDDGTACEKDDVRNVLEKHGIGQGNQPVVVTCHAGMTACGLACIAAHAGFDNIRVYIGSWNEWSQKINP